MAHAAALETPAQNWSDVSVIAGLGQTGKRQTASDRHLAQRAAAGEIGAFEELYKRHHARVYALSLRMTGNAAEAEDLTQDAFIQLHRKVGSFRGESAFTTWLHRMTVNIVLMHFRRRQVRDEKVTDDGELPDQIELGTHNPLKMPIIDRLAIEAALTKLPRGYRSIFLLHDVEGYEHEEISRMLGIAVGTSKSQLHKARMKMRRLLQKKAFI